MSVVSKKIVNPAKINSSGNSPSCFSTIIPDFCAIFSHLPAKTNTEEYECDRSRDEKKRKKERHVSNFAKMLLVILNSKYVIYVILYCKCSSANGAGYLINDKDLSAEIAASRPIIIINGRYQASSSFSRPFLCVRPRQRKTEKERGRERERTRERERERERQVAVQQKIQ